MGIRLHGTPFAAAGSGSETSEPMPVGAVQVTPSGHPVVLLAARGSIGGYPVPATVITADMWLLGQARPGEELRFEVVTEDEAAEAGARSEREREAIQPVRITLQRGGAG
jgi:antagonist of KipI